MNGRPQVFHEACDEQELYSFKKNDKGEMIFTSELHPVGAVQPDSQLHKHQRLDDFMDGVEVGRVKLDASVPNLPAGDKKWHSVWMHLDEDNNEWYATYDDDANTRYNVRRYGYAGLDAKADFPMAARWDWFETTAGANEQVMGFPCARAWCLIGMTEKQTKWDDPVKPEIDPMDPDATGTNVAIPRTRRVRGWFDRFVLANGKSVYLYPNRHLEEFDDEDFDESHPHRVVATLEMNGAPPVPIEIFRQAGAWRSITRSTNPKKSKHVKRDDAPNYPYMPGAVRFGKRLFAKDSLKLNSIAAIMREVGDGDMWIRCASGCCNATIAQ